MEAKRGLTNSIPLAEERRTNQQILILFLSGFTVLFVGMGLFPVLPLYSVQFGASRTFIGIFYALMYVANALGPAFIGWISGRISNRSVFILSGVLGIPVLVLLGQVRALWQLVILTALLWFLGGAIMTLTSIFTGFYSNSENRGKIFSLMALTVPLGAFAGGSTVGPLLSWYDYGLMFSVLGVVWAAIPVIGLVFLQEKEGSGKDRAEKKPGRQAQPLGRNFALLMAIILIAAIAVNMGRLGTSLSMQSLQFSPGAIASSATVSGLVTIPITFLIGVLSDRLGRKRFLGLSFLLAAGGVFVLSTATVLWQFWLASVLLLVAFGVNRALASAMTTDILDEGEYPRGLSWVNTVNASASIVSFAGLGFLIDLFNPQAVYLFIAALPVLAAVVLTRMAPRRRPAQPAAPVEDEAGRPAVPEKEPLVWPTESCM